MNPDVGPAAAPKPNLGQTILLKPAMVEIRRESGNDLKL